MEYVTLANGVKMPSFGFGTFQIPAASCEGVVRMALDAGYRLIDTAWSYQNEEAVGKAIRESEIPREDIFVSTKVYMMGPDGYSYTKKAFEEALQRLGLEYVDMYMIHMPFADYYGAWRAMEEFYREGRIRVLGVCNFSSAKLVDFSRNVDTMPQVDQVERHPFYVRQEEQEWMKKLGVQPQAWAPFAEGMNGMFTNPLLKRIALVHEKTVGQVILRWEIQTGWAAIAKSVHEERIRENFDIWDFTLSDEEIRAISALDLHKPQMLDTENPVEVNRCYDFLEHPVVTSLQNETKEDSQG